MIKATFYNLPPSEGSALSALVPEACLLRFTFAP